MLFHNLFSRISIYTRRAFWARLSMLHVMEFNLWPKFSASQSHGCSELETRLCIKDIRYGLTFNELIVAVIFSYLFRSLFLTALTLLLKTKYSFHIF